MAIGKIRKAVIPAAGLGTRFYPLTRVQPKEMLPLLDKPIIHYVVEEAVQSGLDQILIIVGAGKNAIIDYFDNHRLDSSFANYGFANMPEIYFVRQREQKGLADSIRYSETFVNEEPFVILLGDTVYRSNSRENVTAQLIEKFRKYGKPTIAVEKVPYDKIRDYGIISGKLLEPGVWDIDYMVEKPEPEDAPSDMGITGTYILNESIFPAIEGITPSKNGEYQLTDALMLMSKSEQVIGCEFSGTRYDIGTKELWIKAFFEFAKQDDRFKGLL